MRFLVAVVSAGAALTLDCGVGPDELGLHDLARQERIRTTNSGSGQRRGFRLPRSSSHAFALGLSRAALALHPSWRAGVSRLRRVLAFLRRRLCRQKPRQHQRRPGACRGQACRRQAGDRRSWRRSSKPFGCLSGLSLSFRNLCAVSNRIAAGNPRNPARTRQPMPRALSARAISS